MNKLIPEVRNAYENSLVNKSVCGKKIVFLIFYIKYVK